MTNDASTTMVWLVEHYVEWSNTTILGLYKESGDARDAALAAAKERAGRPGGRFRVEPTTQVNTETGAVTYSVRDSHFTAMPMDVQ